MKWAYGSVTACIMEGLPQSYGILMKGACSLHKRVTHEAIIPSAYHLNGGFMEVLRKCNATIVQGNTYMALPWRASSTGE